MANFEFTQNLSFGQYISTDSWIHQRDTRARILVYFSLIIAVTLARHLTMVVIGLVIILLAFPFAKIPIRYAMKGLKTPLPFLLFIAVLQLFRFQPDAGNLLLLNMGPFKYYYTRNTGRNYRYDSILCLNHDHQPDKLHHIDQRSDLWSEINFSTVKLVGNTK